MSKLNELLKDIKEIESLEDNWNENGAKKFSKKLIDKTRNFVKELSPLPDGIYPVAKDCIQLEWERETEDKSKYIYLEIEIYEDKIEIFNMFSEDKDNSFKLMIGNN